MIRSIRSIFSDITIIFYAMEMNVKLSEFFIDKISDFVKCSSKLNDSELELLKTATKRRLLNIETLSLLRRLGYKQLGFYIHEILEDSQCEIVQPKYEPPVRNPELIARIEVLKVNNSHN